MYGIKSRLMGGMGSGDAMRRKKYEIGQAPTFPGDGRSPDIIPASGETDNMFAQYGDPSRFTGIETSNLGEGPPIQSDDQDGGIIARLRQQLGQKPQIPDAPLNEDGNTDLGYATGYGIINLIKMLSGAGKK